MERCEDLSEEFVVDLGSATEETKGGVGSPLDSIGAIPLGLSDD